MGPDPWDDGKAEKNVLNDDDLPFDLRMPKEVIKVKTEKSHGMSDWFYKRLLAIILKGGQNKENEDKSIEISLQMRYSQEQMRVLEEYIKSDNALSEDMFRRSVQYIGDSIYKPTITEKIAMAWSEYVYTYFVEYKDYITWSLGVAAFVTATFWLWHYISYNHIIILIAIALYMYEVFVSYKEAEKDEVNRFLSAINACKWHFWTSECEVAPPDPLIMLKHMNPLKIAIRMFTTLISEPMITISAVVNSMLHNITADLMYPFNTIARCTLVLLFNALLIMLLVAVVFNYILNIPFQLNLFYILNIALNPRQRNVGNPGPPVVEQGNQGDRITVETLNRFLDVCSKALTVSQSNNNTTSAISNVSQGTGMKRSSSTGRLPNAKSSFNEEKRQIVFKRKHGGSGDAS
ncbi:unnamed protein product [Leptosia nina]|uniref:Chloride channel CLIC-like protein 1 n=1 Tax=Leptosia nina TaxID=320188 RepID=A0AAV1JVX1_9NEOP